MTQTTVKPGEANYVSLATFRRSGVEVATPVWIAASGSHYYVFSEGDAGKVKRLRNNPRVRLAACDIRGKVFSDWIEGTARVVTDLATVADANRALRLKYGWKMKFGDFFSKLVGRYSKRAMIQIELAG